MRKRPKNLPSRRPGHRDTISDSMGDSSHIATAAQGLIWKLFIAMFLACALLPGAAEAAEHYVAPSGTPSGAGTLASPWDLQTALSQPSDVLPGDTIWLRAGLYHSATPGGFVSKLNGSPEKPILVRNYDFERATIDGRATQAALTIRGSYTWFWGLEVIDSTTLRVSTNTVPTNSVGVAIYGPGVKCINMVVHDTLEGFSAYNASPDSEFYGNLSYYNGFVGTDRNHGHGMYFQNLTGTKIVSDNFIGDNADEGIQIYGSGSAAVIGFVVSGNTLYNNSSWPMPHYQYNLIIAGGKTRKNIQVFENYSYFPPKAAEGQISLGKYTPGEDISVTKNVFVGGYQPVSFEQQAGPVSFTENKIYGTSSALRLLGLVTDATQTLSNYTWDNNTYYDLTPYHFYVATTIAGQTSGVNEIYSGWKSQTGFDAHSSYYPTAPKGTWIYIRPNKYEPKRANITIYNWNLSPEISVDLSTALASGDRYVIQDAQNFYGPPVETGTYTGKPVSIRMTGLTKAAPTGFATPAHTAPEFGTFIVLPVHAASK
jgi:hypothetical protein